MDTTAPETPPARTLGDKPDFEWIDLDSLVVDTRYQRAITDTGWRQVRKIAKDFTWLRMAPLVVAGPDKIGDYAIIDGQHRYEAARMRPDVDALPCWVIPAEGVGTQAASFIAMNRNRTGVTRINIFWADLAKGDERARAIKAACDQAGVAISKVGTGRQKPLHTVAVAAIDRCLKISEAATVRALETIATAQPEAHNAFRAPTIVALTRICGLGIEGDRLARLVDALADMDLDSVIEDASQLRKLTGVKVETGVQKLITQAYNKGLSKNRLQDPEGQ